MKRYYYMNCGKFEFYTKYKLCHYKSVDTESPEYARIKSLLNVVFINTEPPESRFVLFYSPEMERFYLPSATARDLINSIAKVEDGIWKEELLNDQKSTNANIVGTQYYLSHMLDFTMKIVD